ncbi:hypothetical protein H4R20_005774, partial [Coemansia guatemalensis]
MGQCAVAVGQHDIGILAFQRALGAINANEGSGTGDKSCQTGNRWRPLQWWSARAAVQTALLRGDVDVASDVIASASKQSRQQAQVLQQVVDGAVVNVSQPRVLCTKGVLRREDSNTRCIAGPCNAVVVRAIDGRVPLAAMGEAIMTFYQQTAMEDMATGGRRLLEQVAFAIDADGCKATVANATSVEAVDIGSRLESGMIGSSFAKDNGASQALAEASGQGSGDTGDNEERGRHKRQSSSSGDDMPAKRRSTRFIERTGSNSATGVHGAGGSGMGVGVAGRATASVRNGVRQGRGMTLEATDSDAFRQGYEATSSWFEAIGVMSGDEFADAFEKSSSVMDACSRQCTASRGRRPQLHGARENDSSAASDWCLHAGGVDSISGDGDRVAAVLRMIEEMDSKYGALSRAHVCRQYQTREVNSEGTEISQEPTLSVGQCQEVLRENGNVFEVLARFVDRAAAAFVARPMAFLELGRLKRASQQAVWIVHEMLVAQAAARLRGGRQTAGWQQAVDSGTLVLALLADAAAGGGDQRVGSGHMRSEWVAAVGGAVGGQRPGDCDPAVARYMVVESWTDYEIAAARNDTTQAAESLTRCLTWLQGFDGDAEMITAARCAHSGAAVTEDVARQRQAQVAQLMQLREAAQVARSDAGRATALLGPLTQTSPDSTACALGFAQQVAATRLLAALQQQLGKTAAAGAAALHELRLYAARLLACGSGVQVPAHLAVRRCVECLRVVYSADTCLDGVDKEARRVAAQLAALTLAAAQR